MLARRISLALATVVAVTVSLVGAATAAPHGSSERPVLKGYTDSADPRTAFEWGGTNVPLGAWRDESGRVHVSRVYLTYDLTKFTGAHITKAMLYLPEREAADCSKRAVEVWETRTPTENPSWWTAPEHKRWLDDFTAAGVCDVTIGLDVGAAVQDAVRSGRTRVSFEVKVPREYERDRSYGRKLYHFDSPELYVAHNLAPSIVDAQLHDAGFPCSSTDTPERGYLAGRLHALPADPDPGDQHHSDLPVEFAVWPQDDPSARITLTDPSATTQRAGAVTVPTESLVDGRAYSWQARANDGVDVSPWSRTCHFRVDKTNPPKPTVTSPNYPPADSEETAPLGEPGVFTFSGGGNQDVAGFEHSWGMLGVPGCTTAEWGRPVCVDPFTKPNVVRADAPGGTATVRLSPPSEHYQVLSVRSLDAAGRVSGTVKYDFYTPNGTPEVSVVGPEPEWNQDVTVRFTAAQGVVGTVDFVYRHDSGPEQVVAAGEDGTATVTVRAGNASGLVVVVRSRSANGWVSTEGRYEAYFHP